MRIATWNVERLKHIKDLDLIRAECERVGADILVLTETDRRIQPVFRNCFSAFSLAGVSVPVMYGDTENRVSVFTNYDCARVHETYDPLTAVCVELDIGKGNLLVYGTVIGIRGNRDSSYAVDLDKQLEDIRRLTDAGHSVCMIGDYNCSFGDNYYFTAIGRKQMLRCFNECGISLLTGDQPECIDHIAVSDRFIAGRRVKVIEEWNQDKSLSDHKGICVEIEE